MPPLPCVHLLLCAIRTCRTNRLLQHVPLLLAYTLQSGFGPHKSLHNRLALMLLDIGFVCEAQDFLEKFGFWDDYLWNATTAGHTKIGDLQRAFGLYEAGRDDHRLHPSSYTFVALLRCCIKMKNLDIAQKLHIDIVGKGLLGHDVFIGSTLISMYIKLGLLSKAEEVFGMLAIRNIIVWTALMDGYADLGLNAEILSCFKQIQKDCIVPDAHAYICALNACANLRMISKCLELHAAVTKLGFVDEDCFVGSTLVGMYFQCGELSEALNIFDKLLVKDVVTWSTLIMGYSDHGFIEDAVNSLKEMQKQGISPNSHTLAFILGACGSVGVTARGLEVYHEVVLFGFETELVITNGIIDMLTKCGLLLEAQAVFDHAQARDIISWSTVITGYAKLGEVEKVLAIFDRMIEQGTEPDILTFYMVLSGCSHSGVLEMGGAYFYSINYNVEVMPTLQHYNCMVDLLVRAGHINKALRVVEMMPLHPGGVIWHSVLGACRKWGELEIARHAFEHCLSLDEADIGAYISMTNIFMDVVMHEEQLQVEVP